MGSHFASSEECENNHFCKLSDVVNKSRLLFSVTLQHRDNVTGREREGQRETWVMRRDKWEKKKERKERKEEIFSLNNNMISLLHKRKMNIFKIKRSGNQNSSFRISSFKVITCDAKHVNKLQTTGWDMKIQANMSITLTVLSWTVFLAVFKSKEMLSLISKQDNRVCWINSWR